MLRRLLLQGNHRRSRVSFAKQWQLTTCRSDESFFQRSTLSLVWPSLTWDRSASLNLGSGRFHRARQGHVRLRPCLLRVGGERVPQADTECP